MGAVCSWKFFGPLIEYWKAVGGQLRSLFLKLTAYVSVVPALVTWLNGLMERVGCFLTQLATGVGMGVLVGLIVGFGVADGAGVGVGGLGVGVLAGVTKGVGVVAMPVGVIGAVGTVGAVTW